MLSRKMNMWLAVFFVFTVSFQVFAHAELYTVNPQVHTVTSMPGWSNFLSIPLSVGTHTVKIHESSTASFGWQNLVYCVNNAAVSDWETMSQFTLNGKGDSRTITVTTAGDLLVGVMDDVLQDNNGAIVIEVDGSELYTVNPKVNVVDHMPGWSNYLAIPLTVGDYTIKIHESSNASFGWQNLVYCVNNAAVSDWETMSQFTLNGKGDSRTITVTTPGDLLVGIMDDVLQDNLGEIIIEITPEDINPPSIESIVINPNSGWAKIGTPITITVTEVYNRTGLTVSHATINGKTITLYEQGNGIYGGTYTVIQNDYDGVNVEATNITLTGPGGTSNPASSTGSTLRIDAHRPGIQSVVITPNSGTVTINDSVNIIVTATNNETGLTSSPAIINGKLVPIVDCGDGTYRGVYTVQQGDPAGVNINATGIYLIDAAGNVSAPGASTGSTLSVVDTNPTSSPPVIQSVVITPNSGWAKIGSSITITATAENNVAGLAPSNALINGETISLTDQGNGTYRGTYTVSEGDNDAVNVEATNITLTGPGGTSAPASSSGSTLRIDAHKPVIQSVAVSPNYGTVTTGNTVVISVTAQGNETGLIPSNAMFNGKSIPLTDQNNGTYVGYYTVQSGDPEGTNLNATGITLRDAAGNVSSPGSSSGSTLSVVFVVQPPPPPPAPIIQSVNIVPNAGYAKVGTTITITVTAALSQSGLSPSNATINGKSVTLTDQGNGTYKGIYTVAEGDNDGINVEATNITLTGPGGTSNPASSTGSTLRIDAHTPYAPVVTISPNSGTITTGGTVEITALTTEGTSGLYASPAKINGKTIPLVNQGSGIFMGVYTVRQGDPEGTYIEATDVKLTDTAGNVSFPGKSSGSSLRVIDTETPPPAGVPKIQSVTINPDSGYVSFGDSVTITVVAENNEEGLIPSDALFNGENIPLSDIGGGKYSGTYYVMDGDREGANVEATDITLSNTNGASEPASSSGSQLIIDSRVPVVQSVTISPMGGTVRNGDNVTITARAAQNETRLFPSPAQFNGRSVMLVDQGDGTYKGIYTVLSSDQQGMNLNATGITLSDAAGNTSVPRSSTGSTLRVSLLPPARPTVTINPNSGIAAVGDTIIITATAADRAPGLIPSPATMNGKQITLTNNGDGTYTGLYIVSASDNSGYNIEATGITLTGGGGTSAPGSSEGSTLVISFKKPVISSVVISPNSGWVTAGDAVEIIVLAAGNQTGLTPSNALINQKSIPLADHGDGTYRGTYIVQSGDEQGGPISATGITLTDSAGNTSLPKSSSGSQLRVDTVIPHIVRIDVEAKTAGGSEVTTVASAGDIIYVTVYALNNETNLIPSNARIGTISFPIIDRHNNGTYYGMYTVHSDDPVIENVTVSGVTLTDVASNRSPEFSSGETGIAIIPDPVQYSYKMKSDFNKDGPINAIDFSLFAVHYGQKEGDPGYDIMYDINEDKQINYSDFSIFASHYGTSTWKTAKPAAGFVMSDSHVGLSVDIHEKTSFYKVSVEFDSAEIMRGFEFTLSYDSDRMRINENTITGIDGLHIVRQSDGMITIAVMSVDQAPPEKVVLPFYADKTEDRCRFNLIDALIVTPEGMKRAAIDEAVRITEIPGTFTLNQNTPNPFNPVTTLRYDIPEDCHVEITIFDITGRVIRVLQDDIMSAGTHKVIWDGKDNVSRNVGSGVYLYQVKAGKHIGNGKMVLVR